MNEQNLKPFTSENQPANRGRKKGVPNRATVLSKWLAVKIDLKQLPPGVAPQKGTIEEQIALALIGRAVKGDVPAIREVYDSVYGKAVQALEVAGKDGNPVEQTVRVLRLPAKQTFDEWQAQQQTPEALDERTNHPNQPT